MIGRLLAYKQGQSPGGTPLFTIERGRAMRTPLTKIPTIGKMCAHYLNQLGIYCVEDLVGKSPEDLYEKDAAGRGQYADRCLLYQFRLAVYFANNQGEEKHKLKWWDFKD